MSSRAETDGRREHDWEVVGMEDLNEDKPVWSEKIIGLSAPDGLGEAPSGSCRS